ncbi:MAG: mechanosensitive ion channel family protein [Chitinophagaceae bacterium]|nr:mechanosensitive ion channel family protein [Chitinophagaceae bacterium]MCW5926069.1 mechanosensitive ion channel family protein [Chitinophagaceae bacterium]
MNFDEWIYFSIYIGSGIVLGIIIRKFLAPALLRASAHTKWKTDDLLVESVSKWIIPWCIVLGAYLGREHVTMDAQYQFRIDKVVFIFYSFSVTWIIARVLSGAVVIKTEQAGEASSSIISNILKVLVYSLGILFILQHFNISITPILTALGVGGLAVALALQDTLSNLFAGVQLISTKKIRQGDFIRLESGQEGFVEDISWRYTTIKTGDNNNIIIPNSKLAGLILLNYFTPQKAVVFNIPVGVDYNSDLEQVEKVTIDVAKTLQQEMDQCVKNFEPFIRYQQFGESSIELRLYMKVVEPGAQGIVKHQLIKRIKSRYDKEGIHIPFPVRTVHINKEH